MTSRIQRCTFYMHTRSQLNKSQICSLNHTLAIFYVGRFLLNKWLTTAAWKYHLKYFRKRRNFAQKCDWQYVRTVCKAKNSKLRARNVNVDVFILLLSSLQYLSKFFCYAFRKWTGVVRTCMLVFYTLIRTWSFCLVCFVSFVATEGINYIPSGMYA